MQQEVIAAIKEAAAPPEITDRLSRLAGLLTCMIGVAIMAVWELHIQGFKEAMPGILSINPVAAFCFILLGLTLFQGRQARRFAGLTRIVMAIPLAIGLSLICDSLLHTHFAADQLLYSRGSANPGNIAIGTAASFSGVSLAFLLGSTRNRVVRLAGQATAIFAVAFLLISVVGYTYGVGAFYTPGQHPIALSSALTFLILCFGLLCRQDYGAMASFRSAQLGGQTARRLLPLNFALPVLTGLVCVYGLSGQNISVATATAIFAVTNICVLVAVTAFAALRLDHLASSLSDRTRELERAKAAADSANKAKSHFLANMSHEMRTPMNGILGMLEVLGYTALNEDQSRIVGTVRTSARTLLDLLNDILDFSKIEANQLSIESVDSDVAEIVESAGRLFLGAAAAKGITLRCFAGATLRGQYRTDPVRLRQIVGNLVSNAVKFTAEGMVTILADIERAPERLTLLRIAVEDTGVGISEETRARLFQPFVQADDSTARRFGGTGLGLSICLRLVKLMHGAITLDSVEDVGSRVTIELPVKPVPSDAVDPHINLGGVKVVIADADDVESRYLAASLAYWQAQVEICDAASLNESLLERAVILAPLTSEEKIRRIMGKATGRAEPQRFVFYSFEDLAQDRRSAAKDALYTTALSRARIVTAIAVAAGRKSPEVEMAQHAADRELGIVVPDREEALRRKQLILLVEDHPVNRDVILRQLRLLGFAADAAENGVAAMAALRRTSYALILTDCNMPEMDGFALTKAIRHGETGLRTLPIVALTANAMAGEAQRCLAAGMDAYLSKPVTLPDLRACLMRWMPPPQTGAQQTPAPAPAPVTAQDMILDLSLLRDCFGDDDAGIAENLQLFMVAMKADMESLADAIDRKSEMEIKHTAHRIKGAARFIGGAQLATASEALEASAANRNWPEIFSCWPALLSASEDVATEIHRRRA